MPNLVLTRKRGEGILLRLPDGRVIKVSVVEFRGSKRVRLAIDADTDVRIVREELE